MYVNTKGTATIQKVVEVQVDPIQVLKDIKRTVCHVPADAYVKDGKVLTSEDISYHGSPVYEHTEHPNVTPNQMEIIDHIDDLIKLLREEMKTSQVLS